MNKLITEIRYQWFMREVYADVYKEIFRLALNPIFVAIGVVVYTFVSAAYGNVGSTYFIHMKNWAEQTALFGMTMMLFGGILVLAVGHYINITGSYLSVGVGFVLLIFGAWSSIFPPFTFLCLIGVIILLFGGFEETLPENRHIFLQIGLPLVVVGWLGSYVIPACPETDVDEKVLEQVYAQSKDVYWVPRLFLWEKDKNGEWQRENVYPYSHPTVQGPKAKAERTLQKFIDDFNDYNENSRLSWTGWERSVVPPLTRARAGDESCKSHKLIPKEDPDKPDLAYDWNL